MVIPQGPQVGPGIRLNLSKRGVGVSFGVKGGRVSVGPRGTRLLRRFPPPGGGVRLPATLLAQVQRERDRQGEAAPPVRRRMLGRRR